MLDLINTRSLRAAVTAIGLLVAGSAGAQRAALVEEIYAPGRQVYQYNLGINPSGNYCPNQFYCEITFPAVPAGKRLVVTYVSVQFSLTGPVTGATGSIGTSVFDSMAFQPGVGTGVNRFVAAGPVTYYFEPGQRPVVQFSGNSVLTSNSAFASVVGYLVAAN